MVPGGKEREKEEKNQKEKKNQSLATLYKNMTMLTVLKHALVNISGDRHVAQRPSVDPKGDLVEKKRRFHTASMTQSLIRRITFPCTMPPRDYPPS